MVRAAGRNEGPSRDVVLRGGAESARPRRVQDRELHKGGGPPPPARIRRSTRPLQRGYIDLWVEVVFDTPDPQPNASFQMEVVYPVACIQQPCPLFTTQSDHRRWAVVGLERGYVVAITPNADTGASQARPHPRPFVSSFRRPCAVLGQTTPRMRSG